MQAASPATSQSRSDLNKGDVSIWPMMVVLYALLLPREVRIDAGGLLLYADRAALLLVAPWVCYKLFKGSIRFVVPDFLLMLSAVWIVVAMCVVNGFQAGIVSGSAMAIDASVGYFLARITFGSLLTFRRALILLAPGLFIAAMLVMIESITHRQLVQPVSEAIFGRLPLFLYEGSEATANFLAGRYDTEVRLGLMRAKGPFTHPILAGLQLASLGALYSMSGLRGWPVWAGRIASVCCFFTVSSAAILALILNYGLMAFDWLQRHIRELSWRLAMIVGGIGLFVIELTTNSGAVGIVSRFLVINPGTAFYRQLIWRFGTDSVRNHPLFGIGFESWERPVWMISESVDNHWLLLAMRYGLIPAVALIAACIMAIFALAKASNRVDLVDQKCFRGIAISLGVFVLLMFTVALMGATLSWFNVLLGSCVALTQRVYRVGYQPLPRLSPADRPQPGTAVRAGPNPEGAVAGAS